ncbi:hypothetical protein ASPBRDRAFT_668751 [Aspergillus brasiliensis CBS 101740]|uniref:ATPase AAA-type core domain-containing protein n=1 Tax=Aspergillus brasiliensis (strain CBS 101740 / IMI 381727 / IBT 21946) TaxID=767769 RepID=A0A1L9UTK8_ASPBC|nr:hypothetical protein ASPBRDRAFT_668751 [Aspergillus brasiliensis CBS 101740]
MYGILSPDAIFQFDDDSRDFWVRIRQLKRYLPIRYTPAPAGFHFFFYRGNLLGFRRQPYKDAGSPWTNHREKVYLYAWCQPVLRDLLDEIQGITMKKNNDLVCVSQVLKDEMAFSLDSKIVDGNSLSYLFLSLPDRCIVLLEDVDQAGIADRGNPDCGENIGSPESSKHFHGGINLSEILNIIDGVSAQEGRILIMTTNEPENIDEARQRPGRVDRIFPFRLANEPFSNQSFIVDPQTLNVNCALESASPEWSLDDIIHLSESFATKVENIYSAPHYIPRYQGTHLSNFY